MRSSIRRERETIDPILPEKYEHPQAADWTPQQTASQTPERTVYPIGLALDTIPQKQRQAP